MDEKNKILAQSSPGAALETVLHRVPLTQNTKVQGLSVCNRSPVASSFRFWYAVRGAPTANAQYVYYDLPISGNNTFFSTMEATLLPTDEVRIYSASGNLSFTLFGLPT